MTRALPDPLVAFSGTKPIAATFGSHQRNGGYDAQDHNPLICRRRNSHAWRRAKLQRSTNRWDLRVSDRERRPNYPMAPMLVGRRPSHLPFPRAWIWLRRLGWGAPLAALAPLRLTQFEPCLDFLPEAPGRCFFPIRRPGPDAVATLTNSVRASLGCAFIRARRDRSNKYQTWGQPRRLGWSPLCRS